VIDDGSYDRAFIQILEGAASYPTAIIQTDAKGRARFERLANVTRPTVEVLEVHDDEVYVVAKT
jgi:hypothetical protein